MELLYLPQHWPCSYQIEDGDEEPFTGSLEKAFLYPNAESVSRIRRPVWDTSPRRHEEQQQQEGEDDYSWYYKHPERYIRRPRRRRLTKPSRQKDEQFKIFDLLLKISRKSWTDSSRLHSGSCSSLGSSIGSSNDLRP